MACSSAKLHCVLLKPGPQAFIAGSHMTDRATGQLRGQGETRADLLVTALVDRAIAARFPMLKGIAREQVERVTIGQLSSTQLLKLLRRGLQFEFDHQGLFHTDSLAKEGCETKNRDKGTSEYRTGRHTSPALSPPKERKTFSSSA